MAGAALGSGLTNYNISYDDGILTVNQAPLSVTADDKSRYVASPNPPLTATISRLMPWDSPAVVTGLTLATTASESSPAGTYPIFASGASAANYTISYVDGALTVLPAATPGVLPLVQASLAMPPTGTAQPVPSGVAAVATAYPPGFTALPGQPATTLADIVRLTGASRTGEGEATGGVRPVGFAPGATAVLLLTNVPETAVARETEMFRFTAQATLDGRPALGVTYRLDEVEGERFPVGATIDPATGAFSWLPGEGQAGQVLVFSVKATDGVRSAEQQVTLTVAGASLDVTLTGVPEQATVAPGQALTFTAGASIGNEAIADAVYSLAGLAGGQTPTGATIDPSTGIFTWTPPAGTPPQAYTFKVRASARGQTVERLITAVVLANLVTAQRESFITHTWRRFRQWMRRQRSEPHRTASFLRKNRAPAVSWRRPFRRSNGGNDVVRSGREANNLSPGPLSQDLRGRCRCGLPGASCPLALCNH